MLYDWHRVWQFEPPKSESEYAFGTVVKSGKCLRCSVVEFVKRKNQQQQQKKSPFIPNLLENVENSCQDNVLPCVSRQKNIRKINTKTKIIIHFPVAISFYVFQIQQLSTLSIFPISQQYQMHTLKLIQRLQSIISILQIIL